MTLLGDRSASFIVRIWREHSDDVSADTVWRGSIESVKNGIRIYFKEMAAIERFLKEHLLEIGISIELSPDEELDSSDWN